MANVNYGLEIISKKGKSKKFDLDDGRKLLGSSKDADIIIEDAADLLDQHCVFRVHNGMLSIHNLSSEITSINSHTLGKGKMYILNQGDKISIGDLSIIILKEEVISADKTAEIEIKEIASEEDEEEDDKTDATLANLADKMEFTPADIDELAAEEDEEEYSESDKHMLEAIQQGVQPESNEKTNIFKRIIRKIKPKLKAEKEPKKRQLLQKIQLPTPNLVIRIFAALVNISFVYAMAYTFLPIIEVGGSFNFIANEAFALLSSLAPSVFSGSEAVVIGLLEFYLWYIVIDAVVHLLLGTSLPFFLANIKSQDHHIAKRAKAALRSLIGNLTFFLVVPDLPAIISRPTLKELVTGSRLGFEGSKLIRIIAIGVIWPIVIVFGMLSPFVLDLENIAGLNFSDDTAIMSKKYNGDDANSINVTLLPFKSRVKADIPSTIKMLPYIKNKGNKVVSRVIFYSDDAANITYSTSDSINLIELVKEVANGNPLFPLIYPALYKMTSSSELEVVPGAEQEFKELLKASMELAPDTYFGIASTEGPFITGNLNFRKLLISKLNITQQTNISIVRFKNLEFIELSPNKVRASNTYHYIPITFAGMNSVRIDFKGKKDRRNRKLFSRVKRFILANSTWFPTDPHGVLAKKESEINNIYEFSASDVLNLAKNNKFAIKDIQVAESIKKYYSIEFAKAANKQDKHLTTILTKLLKSFIKVLGNNLDCPEEIRSEINSSFEKLLVKQQ